MKHRLVNIKKIIFIYLTVLLSTLSCTDQERSRPFIWVNPEERATILEKIEAKAWAAEYYRNLTNKVAIEIKKHQRDTDAYLRGMPLDWDKEVAGQIPPLTYTTYSSHCCSRNCPVKAFHVEAKGRLALSALDDVTERNKYLNHYLSESTSGQDALAKVALHYKNQGDIWPESSQYTNDVAERSTKLMFLLTKYDPSLHLAQKYPHGAMAIGGTKPHTKVTNWLTN